MKSRAFHIYDFLFVLFYFHSYDNMSFEMSIFLFLGFIHIPLFLTFECKGKVSFGKIITWK